MRKKISANHHTGYTADTVFVLVLLCVFAVSVLLVLLTGTGAYQNIAGKMETQYNERTCLSYLDAKVRHYDNAGMVSAELFDGCEALALHEDVEGVRYKTLIYCYDGYVRELFFEDGLLFQPGDGQTIVPARELSVEASAENLIQLECVGETGNRETMTIYLRSGKGADCYA